MSKVKSLSATMVACIDDAREAGGELIRYQGGFWAPRNGARDHRGIPQPYHGASTIQALIARGEGAYTEWKEGRGFRFPIAFKITAALVSDAMSSPSNLGKMGDGE